GALHRLRQEPVGFVTTLVGAEVISLRYVNPVDRARRHELEDLEAVGLCRLERVELFFAEEHVLILCVLESLDQVGSLDELVVGRAKDLLLDPAFALLMYEIERYGFRGGCRVEFDGYRHQTEGNRARSYCARSHGRSVARGK